MRRTRTKRADLRIVLVEDNPYDVELTTAQLRGYQVSCCIVAVATREAFEAELAKEPDLILSDLSVPCFEGTSVLALAKAKCPDVPFVFLTGSFREELKATVLASGADDYVLKGDIKRLLQAIDRLCRR